MKVTDLAKNLAGRLPTLGKQEYNLPSATYEYRAPKHGRSSAMASGDKFHRTFSNFANGSWVAPKYYYPALAICDALADLGVREIQSEVPVSIGNLRGIIDIVGTTDAGCLVVVELKTTLGEYAMEPRTSELFQLATYAHMLGHQDARLACMRIALNQQRINVYEVCANDATTAAHVVKYATRIYKDAA